MLKSKQPLSKISLARRFIICLGISVGVLLTLSLIGAAIASMLDDPTENLALLSLIIMLISAAISGLVSTRIKGDGGAGFSGLVALSLTLIMLLINVIACAGKISAASFMNYACYVGVASISAYLGRKKNKHIQHRK